MAKKNYLIGLIIVACIIVICLLATGRIHIRKHKSTGTNARAKSTAPSAPYIEPATFNVGLIKGKPCTASNLCNDKIWYPPRDPTVEYNLPQISNTCPCTQFIQPP